MIGSGSTRVGKAKERINSSGQVAPWARYEHESRYRFASQFIHDAVVCECASGAGFGTKLLAQAGARQIYGFDIALDAVLESKLTLDDPTVHVATASSFALPVPTQSIDVYVSLETIEHVAHPEYILKEACRVLKPTGVFVCSTPNREITNPGRRRQDRPRNPYHVFEYNLPEFTQDVTSYFGHVAMYGMNFEPLRKVQIMSFIGHVTPGTFAARLNQALKLPRFIYFDRSYHEVRPIGTFPNTSPEYMVAVCRAPRYDG